ncbi:Zinc finger C2H2-type [Trinorchestia longiramus]|nr:Zinc finger C2H2-type [Trinorchestia longiramus]
MHLCESEDPSLDIGVYSQLGEHRESKSLADLDTRISDMDFSASELDTEASIRVCNDGREVSANDVRGEEASEGDGEHEHVLTSIKCEPMFDASLQSSELEQRAMSHFINFSDGALHPIPRRSDASMELHEGDDVKPFSDCDAGRGSGAGIYLDPCNAFLPEEPFVEESSVIVIKEELPESEGHKCDECGDVIAFKRDFIRHLRSRHNMRPFECEQCGKTFTSVLALEDHSVVHNLETPFRCSLCGHSFHQMSALKDHQRSHADDMDFTCDTCGKRLANVSQLKKHMMQHEAGLAYKCEVCFNLFDSKESLETHVRSHQNERPHVCDICNIGFFSAGGLNRHRKVHKRNRGLDCMDDLRCTHCQANFTYAETLKKHMSSVHQIGTQEIKKEPPTMPLTEDRVVEELQEQLNEGYAPKNSELYDVPGASETLESKFPVDPFRCGICEEAFTDVDLMCDHFGNCHTGEQPLYCETCCVGCSNEKQMERHKGVHLSEEQNTIIPRQSEDLPNVCLTCGKSYKTLQELTKHSRVHNVAKHFKCNICVASFPIKSALDKHLLVHTGERPFKCDVCLKSFRQSAALVRHKLWTHRLKNQNKCEICGKTFFTAALLLYHLDVHGDQGLQVKQKLEDSIVIEEEADQESDGKPRSDDEDTALERENNVNNKCEYCSKTFPSYVALLTHKLTHKLSASYKCDQCHRTFREKRYLQKHKLTHRGVRSWKCDICKKGFAAKLTLIRHSQVHIREALRPEVDSNHALDDHQEAQGGMPCTLPSVLRCNECNVNFAHKSHYVRHKLLHSGTPLLNSNFNAHKRIHSGDKPFKCDRCDYKCSQSGRLMKHKRMHSGVKPYLCQTCGKFFANAESLKVHQRLHTGDRPFKCHICGKGFINSGSLNQHLKDHVKEDTYKCDVCPHKFRRESHLLRHKEYHMQAEKPNATPYGYMCEVCGRVFDKKKYLYTHGNVHSRQKNYSCNMCDKQLASRLALKNHEHIHYGLMPFKCSLCSKRFRSSSNLNRHFKLHEGQDSLRCDECNEPFLRKEDLEEHSHVHLMMVDTPDVDENADSAASGDNNPAQLYVFESMSDGIDTSRPILVGSNQQQIFVDGSQPLLVFPEGSEAQFSDLPSVQRDNAQVEVMDELQNSHFSTSSQLSGGQLGSSQVHSMQMSDHRISTVQITGPSLSESQIAVTQISGSQISGSQVSGSKVSGSHLSETQLSVSQISESVLHGSQLPSSQLSTAQLSGMTFESDELENHEPSSTHDMNTSSDGTHQLTSQPMEIAESEHENLVANLDHDDHGDNNQKMINFIPTQVHSLVETNERMDRERAILPDLSVDGLPEDGTVQVAAVAKPYECPQCDKKFAKKQYLTKHLYRHREVKPHECDVCGKRFAQKFEVVVHKIKHTGEKPYSCDICNKQFRSKVNLNNHKMRHNGEFPFLCSVCRHGFSTQLQLERHVTLHTGMLPFYCRICGKGYNIKMNLRKHVAKMHGTSHANSQSVDQGVTDSVDTNTLDSTLHDIEDTNQGLGHDLSGAIVVNERDYKGQITIKSDQDLMEDLDSSAGISLFPKAGDHELSLSGDVTLAIRTSDADERVLGGHLYQEQEVGDDVRLKSKHESHRFMSGSIFTAPSRSSQIVHIKAEDLSSSQQVYHLQSISGSHIDSSANHEVYASYVSSLSDSDGQITSMKDGGSSHSVPIIVLQPPNNKIPSGQLTESISDQQGSKVQRFCDMSDYIQALQSSGQADLISSDSEQKVLPVLLPQSSKPQSGERLQKASRLLSLGNDAKLATLDADGNIIALTNFPAANPKLILNSASNRIFSIADESSGVKFLPIGSGRTDLEDVFQSRSFHGHDQDGDGAHAEMSVPPEHASIINVGNDEEAYQ